MVLETRSTSGAHDFFASSSGAIVARWASVTSLFLNVEGVFLGSASSTDESRLAGETFIYVKVGTLGAITRSEGRSKLGGRTFIADLSRVALVRNS